MTLLTPIINQTKTNSHLTFLFGYKNYFQSRYDTMKDISLTQLW